MRKFAGFAFLLVVCTGLFVACDKKEGDDPAPVVEEHVPDFKITGHPYIQETLNFISNYSASTEMTWDFGDNKQITIAGTETTHAYEKPGNYSVTMSVANTNQVVTKSIRITSGAERVDGDNRWNFFLKRNKDGFPPNLIPATQFEVNFQVSIPDDTTILIPTIPNMPYAGPYKVTLKEVTKEHMVFKSADELSELSYNFGNQRGGIKIVQVRNDTSWHLDGFADIYN